jgi:predicted PurR-regulated permease PerM
MSSDGNSTNGVEQPHVLAAGPNRRDAAIALLAAIAVILMLYWARDVFIPVALALFFSYLLAPPVAWLARYAALPTSIGAAITLALVLGGMGAGIVALEPQAMKLLDTLPTAARKLDRELRRSARDKESVLAKAKEAAAQLEQAATSATDTRPAAGGLVKAAPGPKPEARTDRLFLVGTTTVLLAVVNAIVVIALVYLLLVAGDSFKRKLVKVCGDTLSEKKITVEILDEIDRQVQRYLAAHIGTSALLGVASWGAFALLGLDNAPFWAVAAALLHLMPYVGSALTMVLTGLVAYLQFDDLQDVALVIGSQIAIAYLIGLLLLPWITERMTRINAVTVFVALLFWGWLWGVWGLLLGVPIMMTIKAVCERVEGLQSIAELMGYEPPKPKAKPGEGGAVASA